jgi:hypothetical protein
MRVFWMILLVIAAVAVVAGIASNAYQAGLMRGQAESGLPAPPQAGPPPGATPYPYYYGPYWHRPFGFFGFLFPLLFILLLFALLRGAFWDGRGPWHYGYGAWKSGGVPPVFEEWHRRAHESGQQGPKM